MFPRSAWFHGPPAPLIPPCPSPDHSQSLVAQFQDVAGELKLIHPGGNPGANLKSIYHRCYLREVASEWDLTKETIYLPLGCLQGDGLTGPPATTRPTFYEKRIESESFWQRSLLHSMFFTLNIE